MYPRIITRIQPSHAKERWLIDTGKNDQGMRVIADLHGGDLDDPVAKAEFQEIKDKVITEVRKIIPLLLFVRRYELLPLPLAPIGRREIVHYDVAEV